MPGKELPKEEVLLVGHLCHSKQSANDNASGPAACLEVARTLAKLIRDGDLPTPKRSIRFFFPPEASGDLAFLEKNEDKIPNIIAALNVNMVGVDPKIGGYPLRVSKSPPSMSSYVNTLAELILRHMVRIYPAFWWEIDPIGMSGEQEVFNDPLIGIAMPHIYHEDAYWHTSDDDIENISKEELRKSALFAATYAYFIANAGLNEAIWLAGEVAAEAKRILVEECEARLGKLLESTTNGLFSGKEVGEKALAVGLRELKEQLDFVCDTYAVAIKSVKRLVTKSEEENITNYLDALSNKVFDAAKAENERVTNVAETFARNMGIRLVSPPQRVLSDAELKASKMIVKRLFKGGPVPIYSRDKSNMTIANLDEYDAMKKVKKTLGRTDEALATYWVDGKRNLLEICDLVRREIGSVDTEFLVRFFPFMSKFGWFEVSTK